mgnify:CR=1 FL=1
MEKIIGHKNKNEMKNKDWNPEEWQGRSRRQVETSETLAGISMMAIIAMIVGLVIYNAFTQGI